LTTFVRFRWEFVARACPAGAREATFFHPTLIEHCIRYGEYIEAGLLNQIRFRELALAMWWTLMLVLTNFYAILLRGLRRAGRKDRQLTVARTVGTHVLRCKIAYKSMGID